MRILILSQWYSPEPDIKNHLIARDLQERGHQVTVITGFPNYPTGQIYLGYRQQVWQWDNVDGVRVLRLPLYPDHSRSAIRRSLNYLSFAASASLLGAALCGPADVMWVYSAPLTIGIPACWIGALRQIPFILNINDMWPETVAATGMVSSQWVVKLLEWLGKLVYHRAASIVVVSEGFKQNLIDKGVPASKISVVFNWADEDIYRPVTPEPSFASKHGLEGRFNVVYGGNMGAAQNLSTVIAAAALLTDLPDVQFVLIGDGVEEEDLRRLAIETGTDKVKFRGRQPAELMPCFFAAADILLAHLRRDPLFEITIPGKIFSYMACARPILAALSGEGAAIVQAAGAGITCAPDDPQALADAVRRFYMMTGDERKRMGDAARQTYLTKHTPRVLLGCYADLIEQVCKQTRGTLIASEDQDG